MYSKRFFTDLIERSLSTYVQAFIGLLLAADALNIDAVEAALVSAIPAALSVIKSAIATHVGDKGSASLAPVVTAPKP